MLKKLFDKIFGRRSSEDPKRPPVDDKKHAADDSKAGTVRDNRNHTAGGRPEATKPGTGEKPVNTMKRDYPRRENRDAKKMREPRHYAQPRNDSRGPREAVVQKTPWNPSEYVVPPAEGKVRFQDFDLPPDVMHAIWDLGFKYCTPIQAGILPKLLAGEDAAGRAQTGTGKTAAFLIAIISYLIRNPLAQPRRKAPRVLILAPTRELALQIKKDADGLTRYTDLKVAAILGGMDYKGQRDLLSGERIDIVVATPGRLLDFKKQGNVHLDGIEKLVIDEADRMLDMGFIPDVRRIIESTPPKTERQTVLFSATLSSEINRLASRWTREHSVVEIEPEQVVVKTIKQIFYRTTDVEKFKVLYNLVAVRGFQRVLVFANRKDTARMLKDHLSAHGINCALLSGDVEQDRRIKRLENFRSGKINVLVATDVAARGLHIEGISHVVNYTLPENPEDYVHRVGRTGRAGASGISISFATETDSYFVPAIKDFLGEDIPSVYPEDDLLTPLPEPKFPLASRTEHRRGGDFRRRRPGHGRGSQNPAR